MRNSWERKRPGKLKERKLHWGRAAETELFETTKPRGNGLDINLREINTNAQETKHTWNKWYCDLKQWHSKQNYGKISWIQMNDKESNETQTPKDCDKPSLIFNLQRSLAIARSGTKKNPIRFKKILP